MRTTCFIVVRGHEHEWVFDVEVDPKHLAEIQADGVTIHKLEYTVPAWVVDARLQSVWMFFYDCFHMRNPFRR